MYSKQELWAWLKAENHYRPPKESVTPVSNRASRRRLGRYASAHRGATRRRAVRIVDEVLEKDVR